MSPFEDVPKACQIQRIKIKVFSISIIPIITFPPLPSVLNGAYCVSIELETWELVSFTSHDIYVSHGILFAKIVFPLGVVQAHFPSS